MIPAALRRVLALSLALGAYGFLPARASDGEGNSDPESTALTRMHLSVQRVLLENNGLGIVLLPDNSLPTVAIAITYDVGSKDEKPGQSGFAHLFEHLMFQGSKHLGPGEHAKLVKARGGRLDARSTSEVTVFCQTLPASELALGIWLEAERMQWLAPTPQNLELEKKAIGGELRHDQLSFRGGIAHAPPEILNPAELEAARLPAVQLFHRQYYGPNNAVLSIVGDFDPDLAVQLIRRYFGRVAPRPRPPRDFPPPQKQTAERRETRHDPRARYPELRYSWPVSEFAELELAALILADGESSRLFRRLVTSGVARSVTARVDRIRGVDRFLIEVVLGAARDLKAAERAIDAELRSLGQAGPTVDELNRAYSRRRVLRLFGLESHRERAMRLGEFEASRFDARLASRFSEHADRRRIQEAIARELTPARRSVIELLAQASSPSAAAAKAPPRP